MANKLVTIRHFSYGPDPASQAELARIKLEANGIQCFLAGKNFASMHWLFASANRGIKLQVRESDADKALEILETDTHIDLNETEDKDMKPEAINPSCPNCGSNNIEYEKFSRKLFYLGILVLRFPLPFLKKKYKCESCGEIWK
ncbi:MAG: DUF2007 domain-containing protein [Planctomycetes bacterium]|nr:DUF2007 domain-containing protein [Planctomycetota bacterium]